MAKPELSPAGPVTLIALANTPFRAHLRHQTAMPPRIGSGNLPHMRCNGGPGVHSFHNQQVETASGLAGPHQFQGGRRTPWEKDT